MNENNGLQTTSSNQIGFSNVFSQGMTPVSPQEKMMRAYKQSRGSVDHRNGYGPESVRVEQIKTNQKFTSQGVTNAASPEELSHLNHRKLM